MSAAPVSTLEFSPNLYVKRPWGYRHVGMSDGAIDLVAERDASQVEAVMAMIHLFNGTVYNRALYDEIQKFSEWVKERGVHHRLREPLERVRRAMRVWRSAANTRATETMVRALKNAMPEAVKRNPDLPNRAEYCGFKVSAALANLHQIHRILVFNEETESFPISVIDSTCRCLIASGSYPNLSYESCCDAYPTDLEIIAEDIVYPCHRVFVAILPGLAEEMGVIVNNEEEGIVEVEWDAYWEGFERGPPFWAAVPPRVQIQAPDRVTAVRWIEILNFLYSGDVLPPTSIKQFTLDELEGILTRFRELTEWFSEQNLRDIAEAFKMATTFVEPIVNYRRFEASQGRGLGVAIVNSAVQADRRLYEYLCRKGRNLPPRFGSSKVRREEHFHLTFSDELRPEGSLFRVVGLIKRIWRHDHVLRSSRVPQQRLAMLFKAINFRKQAPLRLLGHWEHQKLLSKRRGKNNTLKEPSTEPMIFETSQGAMKAFYPNRVLLAVYNLAFRLFFADHPEANGLTLGVVGMHSVLSLPSVSRLLCEAEQSRLRLPAFIDDPPCFEGYFSVINGSRYGSDPLPDLETWQGPSIDLDGEASPLWPNEFLVTHWEPTLNGCRTDEIIQRYVDLELLQRVERCRVLCQDHLLRHEEKLSSVLTRFHDFALELSANHCVAETAPIISELGVGPIRFLHNFSCIVPSIGILAELQPAIECGVIAEVPYQESREHFFDIFDGDYFVSTGEEVLPIHRSILALVPMRIDMVKRDLLSEVREETRKRWLDYIYTGVVAVNPALSQSRIASIEQNLCSILADEEGECIAELEKLAKESRDGELLGQLRGLKHAISRCKVAIEAELGGAATERVFVESLRPQTQSVLWTEQLDSPFFDICMRMGEERLGGNGPVLATRSLYFRRLLAMGAKEIDIDLPFSIEFVRTWVRLLHQGMVTPSHCYAGAGEELYELCRSGPWLDQVVEMADFIPLKKIARRHVDGLPE